MATPIWNENEQRWILRLSVDGKRKKFTSTTPGVAGKREVLRRAREYEDTGYSRTSPTVGQLWPEFLRDVSDRSSSEQLRNIELNGRLYILPRVSDRKVIKLSQNDWQRVINEATGKDGRVLAQKSLKNIRGTITSFLVFCFRCGVIASKETSLYIPTGHPIGQKEILQPDEVRRLFTEEFESDWFINLWRIQLLTGMRPGEAIGLQWSDYSGTTVTINRSINARGQITAGKNENAHRVVPLSSLAVRALENQRIKTQGLDSEWIFCNQLGGMPKQALTFDYFKRIALALGRPGVSPYGLRHTFVSMLKHAIPEQMIKTIVGHSVSMDTMKIYGSHEVDGEQQIMAAALDAAFSSTVAPVSPPVVSSDKVPPQKPGAVITQLCAN